jgi:molecular chaperone IbpA
LDRVFDLLDSAFSASQADEGYPPLNITKTDETCRSRWLRPARSIDRGAGECADRFWQKNTSEQQLYLHNGIASPAFERRFNLADCVKVASADLVNGLLTIELVREIPEAMRPRQIQIGGSAQSPEQLEHTAA